MLSISVPKHSIEAPEEGRENKIIFISQNFVITLRTQNYLKLPYKTNFKKSIV